MRSGAMRERSCHDHHRRDHHRRTDRRRLAALYDSGRHHAVERGVGGLERVLRGHHLIPEVGPVRSEMEEEEGRVRRAPEEAAEAERSREGSQDGGGPLEGDVRALDDCNRWPFLQSWRF